MSAQLTSFSTVGLRHVIEDTLAVFQGTSLPSARREYVLNDMLHLCREAKRGSQIASQRSRLFLNPHDEPAFEQFSLLARYLDNGLRTQWVDQLDQVCSVLEAVLDQREPADVQRDMVVAFLGNFLRNLRRQGSMDTFAKSSRLANHC